jgi:excisionase family DNA binding protein
VSAPVIVTTAEELARIVREAVRAELEARDVAANDAPEWIDAKAAAAILRVHPRTIGNLAASGKLPSTRVGRLLRFRRADVLAYLGGAG